MNDQIKKRLEQIKIENNIWVIYLIIIALSYYSNNLEKDYFINKNEESKNNYRKINILIFTILVIVYLYFEKESLDSIKEKNKTENQKRLGTLSFVGSTAVLISGLIFLYIAISDTNLEEEIAFN